MQNYKKYFDTLSENKHHSGDYYILWIVIAMMLVCLVAILMFGCASPGEKLLTKVNYDVNYSTPHKFGECRTAAEQKVKILTGMGIKAEVVHCDSRYWPYEWHHAVAKAYVDGQWWCLDNGVIIDVPWKYSEVQKSCYDFVLP